MTEMKLKTMPFARQIPKSGPILNSINISAINPNNVVSALAATVVAEALIAWNIASSTSSYSLRKSAKLWSRKIA